MANNLTSSGSWASLDTHCVNYHKQCYTLTSAMTVPSMTGKDQKVADGPIPVNSHPFPEIVGIILPVISLWNSSFRSVQSLTHVQLFATPRTAARQASLSITNSWSLHKLMSIESVMPSNHLILYHPLSSCLQCFPASGSFQMSQFFTSGGQSFGVSTSASVLPMNIQDWFPLGLTGLITLLSKELSRVFSNTTVQKHQFFGAQLSLWSNSHIPYMTTRKTIALSRWTFVGKVMSLLLNMLPRLDIAFLPRSKLLLISWL